MVVVFTRENRGGSAQHATRARNTGPFKPRTDESLALCHPYTACTVAATVAFCPHHPACAQQNGENFPIGEDPSESSFASS